MLLLGCCCVGEGKQGVLWKCYTTKVCRVRYRLRELGREAADCHKTEPASRTPSLSVLSPRAECLQILALWQNPDKGWLLEQNPDKYWLSGQNPDKHWLPEMALWVEYALESEFRCRLILQAESWLSKSKTCHTLLSKKSIRLSNPSNPWVS